MAQNLKLEYAKMTWPEVKAAAERDPVVVIPVGAIEDHGLHLPLDTDILIAGHVCRQAVEQIGAERALLMPPIWFGYESHHMDFPGTIDISWDIFVKYALCVTKSLAHHGFRRILLVNGHGSNRPLIDMVARLTTVHDPRVLCAALSWFELTDVREAFDQVRESESTSHACELETSAYLALDPDLVQMDKAVNDEIAIVSPHTWRDLTGRRPRAEWKNPIAMTEIWSTVSATGTRGDATKSTAEKGKVALDAAVGELVEIIVELKERPIRRPVSHQ
jgi:creatinine amidohydrolase